MKNKISRLFLSTIMACMLISGCQTVKIPPEIEGISQRVSDDYGRIALSDRYVLLNSVWNKRASFGKYFQEIFGGSAGGRDFLGWSWQWSSDGRWVVSYPEVYCGSSPWDPEYGTAPEFPFSAGSKKVTVTFDVDLKASGKYDMAFDIWAISRMPNVSQNISKEIMIWNVNTATNDWSWAKKLGSPKIDGVVFDVYEDPNHSTALEGSVVNWTNILFVPRTRVLAATWHVDEFIDFLLSNGTLTTDNSICNVEFGVEVYYGAGVVKVYDYSVDVE